MFSVEDVGGGEMPSAQVREKAMCSRVCYVFVGLVSGERTRFALGASSILFLSTIFHETWEIRFSSSVSRRSCSDPRLPCAIPGNCIFFDA